MHSGGCLELYYCNMVEWFWSDSSLISTTNWFPSVLWHCWFGHLACKNCPRNDYNVLSGMLTLYTIDCSDLPATLHALYITLKQFMSRLKTLLFCLAYKTWLALCDYLGHKNSALWIFLLTYLEICRIVGVFSLNYIVMSTCYNF